MPSRPPHDRAAAFREAIAQWQLAARTAVKRSSSLPSGVFGACDPMLEARLAESAQKLISHLQKPTGFDQSAAPEMRRERVEPHELAQLRRRAGANAVAVDLTSGQTAELLGVLLDLVATSPAPHNQTAMNMLREAYGVGAHADLEAATDALAELVRRASGADASPAEARDLEEMIAALCTQVASAALLQGQQRTGGSRPAEQRRVAE